MQNGLNSGAKKSLLQFDVKKQMKKAFNLIKKLNFKKHRKQDMEEEDLEEAEFKIICQNEPEICDLDKILELGYNSSPAIHRLI